MNRSLISVGTGVISFAGTVAFGCRSFDSCSARFMGLATVALGLAARNACLKEGENFCAKDWILISGAGVIGTKMGLVTVAAIVQWIVLNSQIFSTKTALVGAIKIGKMLGLPISVVFAIAGVPFHHQKVFSYCPAGFWF